MSKHTPGPWFQSHRKCPDGMFRTQVYDSAEREIATMAWTPRLVKPGVTETDRDANAALTAAAPDLLAACKAFLIGKPQCDCSDDSGCSLATARKMARAAIAKAEAAR